ncbi:hypothetical protein KY359_02730 [Candidatus Woesearchaeota archaeon]|nr:hypothetical protein [Candidatus Woesearchaeota archaeon]
MVFSKSFPREVEGSNFPRWEEIFLSAQEEREREQVARQENLFLIRQCIADARNVLKDEKMMDMQSHVLSVALSLFKKRASHAVYYKEEKCHEKFLKYWGKFKQKKAETADTQPAETTSKRMKKK